MAIGLLILTIILLARMILRLERCNAALASSVTRLTWERNQALRLGEESKKTTEERKQL